MNIYSNFKDMVMFNDTYRRAGFCHKRRVRKKNYKRAKIMMFLSNPEYRRHKRGYRAIMKWNARKICGMAENRLILFQKYYLSYDG